MRLKTKLILSFGGVVVGSVIVLGMIAYVTFAGTIRQNRLDLLQLKSTILLERLQQELRDELTGIVTDLAITEEGIPANHLSGSLRTSLSREEEKTLVRSYFLYDLQDHRVSYKALAGRNQSWPQKEVLRHAENFAAAEGPQFAYLGDSLYLFWPLYQQDDQRYLFVATMDHRSLKTFIRDIVDLSMIDFILSEEDRILLSSLHLEQYNLPTREYKKLLTNHQEPLQRFHDFMVFSPDKSLFNLQLHFIVPNTLFYGTLISLKNRVIAATLLIGWVGIWITLIFAYRISAPIQRLSSLTKDMINLNYNTSVPPKVSNDEIGELARSFETMRLKIKNLIVKDPLTHTYNRRFLMHIFELAALKAMRTEEHLSCILLDIDHFKSINDTYGHQGGDQVLICIGKLLNDAMRNYDTAARYGGEEFLIVLPQMNLEEAVGIAERIRKQIEGLVIHHEGKTIACTISAGVATFDFHEVNSPTVMISKADLALYAAKNGGRNRVERHSPNQNENGEIDDDPAIS